MNNTATYATNGDAVLYLDRRQVTSPERLRATVYDAWRSHDFRPLLPMSPLRYLAITQRNAELPAFPVIEPDTPITEGVPEEKLAALRAAHATEVVL